jgi:hypothetical protein
MKKLLIFCLLIMLARFASGCGLLPPKVYDGSESAVEANPGQAQPMPYMDPDNNYSADTTDDK